MASSQWHARRARARGIAQLVGHPSMSGLYFA
jgi:hypothetical protein